MTASPTPSESRDGRVILITRPGCHLCDEARPIVAETAARFGETIRELDVDQDPDLRERYSDMIPVVLVDGIQVGFWRIDAQRLERALQG